MKKRVLLLFSDTGGGHRAAAEAIRDALHIRHPGEVETEMIDVFRAYTPFPLKYMPEMYPWIINLSKSSWSVGYKLTNTRQRAKLITDSVYASAERGFKRMAKEHPADVVVCVHSLLTSPSMRAFRRHESRPPFITVVTDLVSTHMFWYDKRVERCLVPTQAAFDRGLEANMSPEQMRVTGLPVHPHFEQRLKAKAEARQELGWDADLPTILLVGGSEGMGPLYQTVRAINDQRLRCQLVVIAGRNEVLREELEKSDWNQPTHVYGFVTNMPLLMAAADILVSKAGPATISEACIAGLPVILYDAIPGQEDGNIDFVVENEAGVYAPSPEAVTQTVRSWLAEGTTGLQRRSENARRIGRPEAVWTIAEEAWELAQRPPIPNVKRSLNYLDLPKLVSVKQRRY